MELGKFLQEVTHHDYGDCVQQLKEQRGSETLFVTQGGADQIAQLGIKQLANEIKQWQKAQKIKELSIVTPSGTGTTAYYLAKHLPKCNILTTAVVGDKAYLISQMEMLGALPRNISILESDKKYQFGKLYPELLAMYHDLLAAGITFDLIYGAVMWQVLLQHCDAIKATVLYVHSGGLMGNTSMLDRYHHQGML